MAQKLVTVTIDKIDGSGFTVDTSGFNGKGCADIHKMFEGIGGAGKATKKPEWDRINVTNEKVGR